MTQTVVVTGASAGVGRAVARRYAERGARLALLARGEAGLAAAERDVPGAGRARGAAPTGSTSPTPGRWSGPPTTWCEPSSGGIDVWVNNAMASVFARRGRSRADRVPAGHRGQLPRHRARHPGRAAAHAGPRDRGAIVQVGSALAYRGIPLQSAYCGAQARDPGLQRLAARRAAARRPGVQVTMVQTARDQHPAVLLGAHPAAPPGPAGAADLRTRGGREGDRLGGRPRAARAERGRTDLARPARRRLAPGLLDRKLARDGYDSQQTDDPIDPAPGGTTWTVPGTTNGTGATEGVFTDRARGRSAALWIGTHKPAVSGAALAGAGGGPHRAGPPPPLTPGTGPRRGGRRGGKGWPFRPGCGNWLPSQGALSADRGCPT